MSLLPVCFVILLTSSAVIGITMEVNDEDVWKALGILEREREGIVDVTQCWKDQVNTIIQNSTKEAHKTCVERLDFMCSEKVMAVVMQCVESDEFMDSIELILKEFNEPLLRELKEIEEDLKDQWISPRKLAEDVWYLDEDRSDGGGFIFRKNEAQSHFIMKLKDIQTIIAGIFAKCYEPLF